MEPGQERSNELVLDAFMDLLPRDSVDQIERFLKEKRYIFDQVKARNGVRHFFSQPAVLLAYFLSNEMPEQTREYWPIGTDDLSMVFSDLGITYV
jgi:hypothetical protein